MSIVAAQKPEHRQVKKLVDGLMVVASIWLLLYVVVGLVNNWGSLDKGDLLQQFALPVWLTIGVLPYIYALGLFAAYEQAFIRVNWKSERGLWARTRSKLVLLTSFHVRAREVGAFSGPWQFKFQREYQTATERSRRAYNQALFEAVFVKDRRIVGVRPKEPYRTALTKGGSDKNPTVEVGGVEPPCFGLEPEASPSAAGDLVSRSAGAHRRAPLNPARLMSAPLPGRLGSVSPLHDLRLGPQARPVGGLH